MKKKIVIKKINGIEFSEKANRGNRRVSKERLNVTMMFIVLLSMLNIYAFGTYFENKNLSEETQLNNLLPATNYALYDYSENT